MHLHQLYSILGASLVLCLLAVIRSLYLATQLKKERASLLQAKGSLQVQNQEVAQLKKVEKRFHQFRQELQSAEVSTGITKTRHLTAEKYRRHSIPDRYRYIHSLHKRGIDAKEIASILVISPQEADQLVALANLGNK